MTFHHKSVLVTGASGGIGAEICRQFTASGATVIAVDINEAALLSLKQALGAQLEIVVCNLRHEEKISDLASKLSGRCIDILVNNAGVGRFEQLDQLHIGPVGEMLLVRLEDQVKATIWV